MSIQIRPGYDFWRNQIDQAIEIADEKTIVQHGWDVWTIGRIIKYQSSSNEILGTYLPAFPIVGTDDYQFFETIQMMAMTENNGYIWISARIRPGSGIRFLTNIRNMLMIIDNKFPRPLSEDHEDQPIFLPILKTIYFDKDQITGFGIPPQGAEGFGGPVASSNITHKKIEFIDSNVLQVELIDETKAQIFLKNEYFVHEEQDGQVVLLFDPRSDQGGSSVVIS